MATIKEVAKHAGVSIRTVSRVLNDSPHVATATRERVLRVIEEFDFRPNAAARYMRTGQSQLIGFLTDEVAQNVFSYDLIIGAQQAAWEHEKLLFLLNTGNDPHVETQAINIMRDHQVEGIIYATMYHREIKRSQFPEDIPAILVNCFADDRSLPSIVPDEIRGGRLATETLLEHGHRRVGFVNVAAREPAPLGRLEGYRQALSNYGIPFDEALVRFIEEPFEGLATSTYECVLSLLQMSNPPTGIFCFNDMMALGAYDAVRKSGLRIPEDVAIVGFDNVEILAAQIHPPLTTIELPNFEMGQLAIQMLLGEVDITQDGQPVQHMIECPLIARQSV
ncbi:LacI family DNA-binding transcriptional regulator [Aggregatilinea lenta]|uniref:LacI family DNA-binding transcriptional regulator n=1 Tax=Aggregatilinea lenta TaxID=913108 RepID=UPI001EE7B1B5|nr:LacI family DNA-binding transcriptional regulator [Aggregatilinea lenta]